MTDVLDGRAARASEPDPPADDESDQPADQPGEPTAATPEPGATTGPDGRLELPTPLRHLLAALSAAAGAVHLAMVPSHVDEWAAEGAAFAVAGWAQLAMALLAVTRPSRRLLQAMVAANLAFVAAWAVTRTTGSPFGPHAGHAESASAVDLTTVAFELLLVVLAGMLLLGRVPGWLTGRRGQGRGGLLAGTVAPIVVVAVTTAVLASPSASDHAHDTHDGHGDGDAAGHAAMGHGHAAGEGGDGGLAPVLQEDDRGLSDLRNGHHHEIVEHELDAATQRRLDEQLDVTREVAARYPTLADARDAGFTRIGPYFPGIGAHYRNPNPGAMGRDGGIMDREALLNPFVIVYDGSEPTARIAGFMYLTMSDEEPEGFAGPNDVWHNHQDLCLRDAANGEIDVPFGLDHAASEAECSAVGGDLLPISPWMVHVWSAPGYDDDPDVGVFHEVHTDLTCEDGTYHMLPPEEWTDNQLNVCRAGAA
jgi:hypothetical protein